MRTEDLLSSIKTAQSLTEDSLREALRGASFVDRLRALFAMQVASSGTAAAAVVDNYLLFLLQGRDVVGRVLDCANGPEARTALLGEMQGLVLASALDRGSRAAIAAMLDKAQHDFLKTTQILSPLRKPRAPLSTVLTVVDMLGAGQFTVGTCASEARSLVVRHIRHREFVRSYVLGADLLHSDSAPDPTIAERITSLANRLQQAGIPFTDPSRLRVLVVDDEEAARSYIEMVLTEMGIGTVLTASDGRKALDVFQDFEDGIDIIVCDWMMPRMSGLDFLKQVRSVRPTLPFLMVTALATKETVERALAHEVTGYIAKPFPPEQLEEKVLLLISRAIADRMEKDPAESAA